MGWFDRFACGLACGGCIKSMLVVPATVWPVDIAAAITAAVALLLVATFAAVTAWRGAWPW